MPVPITVTATPATGGNSQRRAKLQTLTVDFGDGSTETRTNVTGAAGFTHTYRNAGGYTITATAPGRQRQHRRRFEGDRHQSAAPLPTLTVTATARSRTTASHGFDRGGDRWPVGQRPASRSWSPRWRRHLVSTQERRRIVHVSVRGARNYTVETATVTDAEWRREPTSRVVSRALAVTAETRRRKGQRAKAPGPFSLNCVRTADLNS